MQKLRQVLVKIEQQISSGRRPLIVFDLDSTLFNVSPRTAAIVADFIQSIESNSDLHEHAQILKKAQFLRKDWGLKESLLRLRAEFEDQSKAPFPPEFLEGLRHFWRARFFSNDYLVHDQPYEGAVEFAHRLEKVGCEIFYLTGRDVPSMGSGTEKIMVHWGFPRAVLNKTLFLKPDANRADETFKVEWFNSVQHKQDEVWVFENEPWNIQMLRAKYDYFNYVFFNSTHSRRVPEPLDVFVIEDYLLDDL